MTEQSITDVPAREQRTVEVIINDKRYRFDHHLVTGRQIKEKAGIPDSYSLYLRRPGDNEPIADDEEVTLREGDVFFSRPPVERVMTEEEFSSGVAAAATVYPHTRLLPPSGTLRPLRVAPVPIPGRFWGGGTTRALLVFDLATHEVARPRGLLGPEWRLPDGATPHNASAVFEFGEAWQAFSWAFAWPPALGVIETVEAYLGRFSEHR